MRLIFVILVCLVHEARFSRRLSTIGGEVIEFEVIEGHSEDEDTGGLTLDGFLRAGIRSLL